MELTIDAHDQTGLSSATSRYLNLPRGCFLRAPLVVWNDIAWKSRYDYAAVSKSANGGQAWQRE